MDAITDLSLHVKTFINLNYLMIIANLRSELLVFFLGWGLVIEGRVKFLFSFKKSHEKTDTVLPEVNIEQQKAAGSFLYTKSRTRETTISDSSKSTETHVP